MYQQLKIEIQQGSVKCCQGPVLESSFLLSPFQFFAESTGLQAGDEDVSYSCFERRCAGAGFRKSSAKALGRADQDD